MEENQKPFSQNDYEIEKREVLFQGIFRIARYHVRHRKFSGRWTNIFSREIFERVSAAGILPYDPIRDSVVLIEQFRAGAIANPQSPWLIEIVAGLCDDHEAPASVAVREADEEAGVKIMDICPIYDYFVSPGGSNEYINLYCGRVDASEKNSIHGLADENEDIRAFVLTVDEACEWLRQGKIKTAPAIIALQWLQLNREWLKKLWQIK